MLSTLSSLSRGCVQYLTALSFATHLGRKACVSSSDDHPPSLIAILTGHAEGQEGPGTRIRVKGPAKGLGRGEFGVRPVPGRPGGPWARTSLSRQSVVLARTLHHREAMF